MTEVCSSNEKLQFIKIRLSSGATNAKLLFLNIRQRNHGDSIASTSPWTRRIAQSVLRFISIGARESLLLKLAMLSLSLRNADNIKWNLSCIQYQSRPDRSAMLARAVAKLYQLTSVLSSVVGSMCFATLVPVSWCVFSYYDSMIEIIFMMSQCALYVCAWRQMYNNKQSWILNLESWIYSLTSWYIITSGVSCVRPPKHLFLWPHGSCITIEIVHEDQLWKLFTRKIKWKRSSKMVSWQAWSATLDKTL